MSEEMKRCGWVPTGLQGAGSRGSCGVARAWWRVGPAAHGNGCRSQEQHYAPARALLRPVRQHARSVPPGRLRCAPSAHHAPGSTPLITPTRIPAQLCPRKPDAPHPGPAPFRGYPPGPAPTPPEPCNKGRTEPRSRQLLSRLIATTISAAAPAAGAAIAVAAAATVAAAAGVPSAPPRGRPGLPRPAVQPLPQLVGPAEPLTWRGTRAWISALWAHCGPTVCVVGPVLRHEQPSP